MKIGKLLLCAAVLTGSFAVPAVALPSGWAIVAASGVLVRGGGTLSAAKNGTGTYLVAFTHIVKKCVFTASIGDGSPDIAAPGYVSVAGANANSAAVFVAVFDKHGNPVDAGFHLNVRC